MRTFGRYWLFQLPELLAVGAIAGWLHAEGNLRPEYAAGLVALAALKDLALYPLVRRGYESSPSNMVGVERLLGAEGLVLEELDPSGWVRMGSELWRAELGPSSGERIAPGERVRVLAVRDLTLVVKRAPPQP